MRVKKLIKNRKGFTLTELVVTTAIMGTLAAVAVPSFLETNTKAKTAKTMANIADIGAAIGQRFNEIAGEYGTINVLPGYSAEADMVGTLSTLGYGSEGTVSDTLVLSNILPNIPKSPFGDTDYKVALDSQSSVTYTTDDDGNVTVAVTKAKITIRDVENAKLTTSFEY